MMSNDRLPGIVERDRHDQHGYCRSRNYSGEREANQWPRHAVLERSGHGFWIASAASLSNVASTLGLTPGNEHRLASQYSIEFGVVDSSG